MHYAGRNAVSKYQRRLRWETLNPLLSVRKAEILSLCVKAIGEAESEVNYVSNILYGNNIAPSLVDSAMFFRKEENCMGMYDTINGQQVKCFPWVSLYKEEISYHGGTLNYFKNGSKVPYKAPHYNYGKNFIILDFNRFPESGYENYDYVIHVIKNGKVKETALEKEANVDWAKNGMVVDYYGTELNIHSHQDILDYIKDQREYKEKLDMINSHWNELFKESMKYFSGIGLLEKDSEEYKMRYKKIKEVHKLMEKEKKRIKPELDALNKEYEHWVVDTSSTEDCLTLGEYISASNLPNGYTDGEKEKCESIVKKMLQADNTLYDRYVKWQGDDAFLTKYL